MDAMVAGRGAGEDDEESEEYDAQLRRYIDSLSAEDRLAIVPFLCRLGYSVMAWELVRRDTTPIHRLV